MEEIEKIKDSIELGQLVAAQEVDLSKIPTVLTRSAEEAIATFDKTQSEFKYFLVTVREPKMNIPAPTPVLATDIPSESESLSDLVNQTLKLTDTLTQKRVEQEKTEYDENYLLDNAKILEASKEYVLARNIYKSLLKKGKIAEGLAGIGRTFEAENNLPEAERFLKEALAYSSSVENYQSMVSVLIRLTKDEEAAKHLNHALGLTDLKPEQKFEFFKTLGNCYARLGDLDRAAHQYGKAYDINPQSDVLQVNVGSLALQKGDAETASIHFKKALEINSKNDKAINGMGMVSLLKNETQKAHDYFAASLEIEINNIGAIYNLVKTAYELKRFDVVARIFEAYMKHNPESRTNSNIIYSYCGILYHLGHHNTALSEAEVILKLNPQHSGAKEIKALIASAIQGRNL